MYTLSRSRAASLATGLKEVSSEKKPGCFETRLAARIAVTESKDSMINNED